MLTKAEFSESSKILNTLYAEVLGTSIYDSPYYRLLQGRLRELYSPYEWLRLPNRAVLPKVIEKLYRETELTCLIALENLSASKPYTLNPPKRKAHINLVRETGKLIRVRLKNKTNQKPILSSSSHQ